MGGLGTRMNASSTLYNLLKEAELPKLQDSYPLMPLTVSKYGLQALLPPVLDCFMDACAGGRNDTHKDQLRKHFSIVLLNLSQAMFSREWVGISLNRNSYSQSDYAKEDYWTSMRLGYDPMKAVLSYLQNEDYVEYKKGYRSQNGQPGRISKFFPKPKLQEKIWELFLETEEEFKPPYVKWNKFKRRPRLIADHPDLLDMEKINNFLLEHRFAAKGPMRLIYSGNPLRGGRIDCRFQRLPSRRLDVRKRTLIDSEEIVELDFSANHLRMANAIHGQKALPEDPYLAIAEKARARGASVNREQVKGFVTKAIGEKCSREKAFAACKEDLINKSLFNTLEASLLSLFPDTPLYADMGSHYQSLEGVIAKQVMLAGVDDGVVVLPVHDAFAVQKKHAEWLREQMEKAWYDTIGELGISPVIR
jgi:hypothetical protein